MELTLQKVGIINKATVKLNGLTVICGSNNSGKSTAGKALYATIESLSNLEEKLHDELVLNYRRALMNVSRILGLDSISKYVDFSKMQEVYNKDFSVLVESVYRYRKFPEYENIVEAYISLKDAVEILDPHLLMEFAVKSKSDLPKKFFAYLENLDKNYNYKDFLANLSSNPKIKDQSEAYDYDKIKERMYGNSRSVDALLIKRNLNLIEFKTGFDSTLDSVNEKVKKENMALSIRIKAYESLHLLQTAIIDEISDTDKLSNKIKIVFCAVIDTNEPVVAEDAYVDILSDEGGVRENKSLKVKVAENVMSIYRKETDKHKKLFYDDAFVLYDYEFDKRIGDFK